MTHAYGEVYVFDVKQNLGALFDVATDDLGMDYDDIAGKFALSQAAHGIETGHPRYLCGISGIEMLSEVLGKDLSHIDRLISYPPEFWAGWTLAQLQWSLDKPFKEILDAVPFGKIVSMYDPYHEAGDDVVVDKITESYFPEGGLRHIRVSRGFSQKELSDFSGVNIRTIRAYEQGTADIGKAAADTLYSLAKALCCTMESLMKRYPKA